MIDNAFQTFLDHLAASKAPQFKKGLEHWRKGIQTQLEQLAMLSFKRQRYAECKQLYDAFLSLKKSVSTQHLINYSLCLKYLKQPKQQLEFLKKKTKLFPDSYQLWFALGNAQKANAQPLAAKESYARALALNPKNIDLMYSSTGLSGFRMLSADSIEHLKSVLDDPKQPNKQKSLAAFILGHKLIEDQQIEKGFSKICLANQLHLQDHPLRLQFDNEHLTKLIEHFTRDFFNLWRDQLPLTNQSSNDQIFIIGMSRSGKTLIENILNLSADIQPEQESMTLTRFVRRHLDNRPKANLSKFINNLNASHLAQLQQDYHHSFASSSKVSSYTMPWNITDLGYVGLLNPEAKVIFITRDHLDLGLACFNKVYAIGNSYASELGALGQQIALYERLIQHWQCSLPNPCMTISYEELVKSPSKCAQQLFQFCQLKSDLTLLNQKLEQATKISGNFSQSQDFLTKITDKHIGISEQFRPWLEPLIKSYHQCWQTFS